MFRNLGAPPPCRYGEVCVWGGASWNSVFWVCLGCEHEPGLQDRASKAQMCQFETCGTDSLLPTQ